MDSDVVQELNTDIVTEEEAGTVQAPVQRVEPTPAYHLRIEPSKGWVSLKLRELWEYRELLYFLTWRDIKVRYKQTVLGAAWAIIQPFFTMVVFSLFFGNLAKVPSDGIPYPISSRSTFILTTGTRMGGSRRISPSPIANSNASCPCPCIPG